MRKLLSAYFDISGVEKQKLAQELGVSRQTVFNWIDQGAEIQFDPDTFEVMEIAIWREPQRKRVWPK